MDISRVSAIVLAMLAAVLIIVAGKSCVDDAISQKSGKHSSDEPNTFGNLTPGNNTLPEYDDITVPQETGTEIMYEEVTNMLGEVIETIPITEAETEPSSADTTKSILEAYEELHATTAGEPVTEPTTKYIEPATDIVIYIG